MKSLLNKNSSTQHMVIPPVSKTQSYDPLVLSGSSIAGSMLEEWNLRISGIVAGTLIQSLGPKRSSLPMETHTFPSCFFGE